MRPIGAAVHIRAGTVNFRLVRWMVAGSVPAAFLGAYLLHLLGDAKSAEDTIEVFLGAALLIGAGAMALRFVIDRRSGQGRDLFVSDVITAAAADAGDRDHRRRHRGNDLGGLRVADDRRAAVHLSADRRQPAGGDRPHAGGAADRWPPRSERWPSGTSSSR